MDGSSSYYIQLHQLFSQRNSKSKALNGLDVLFLFLDITILLFIAYQLPNILRYDNLIPRVNQILPIILTVSSLWVALRIVRQDPVMIWSPLPWFLGACAVYFGFGPLIYYFGTQESIWYIDQFYFVSEDNLLRTNALNVAGIGLVILGFLIGSRFFKIRTSAIGPFGSKEQRRIAIAFLGVGLPVKYLLYMPYIFGETDFILPGSIMQLRYLTALAIIPIMFLIKEGHKKWRFIFYLLIASELAFSALEFSKVSFIITLIIITSGWFFIVRRIRILSISFILIIFAYYVITPLVNFGRINILRSTGAIYQAGLKDRLSITSRFLSDANSRLVDERLGGQAWWIRLNYANAQSCAMDRYDVGSHGRSFGLAIYTIIPRIIWPEKPSISDVGLEFNYLATSSDNSSSAPGIFAEAYWNGGWLLVVGACLYVGVLFSIFSEYARKNIMNSEYIYLPIILMGIIMGLRPDGWFAVDYVGVVVIAFFTHFLLKWVFMKLVYRKRQLMS